MGPDPGGSGRLVSDKRRTGMVPRAPAGMVHGVEDGEKHVKPKQGDTIAIKLQRNGEWLVEIWVGDACIHSTTPSRP
jgi:hypothetical protein